MAKEQVGDGVYGVYDEEDDFLQEEIDKEINEAIAKEMVEEEADIEEIFEAPPDSIKQQKSMLEELKLGEASDHMLMTGNVEDEFPIFGGKMTIRVRTLSAGEKALIARNVERTGSLLGLESYKLLTLIETFARAIVSIDGEPVAPELETVVSPAEKYRMARRVIEKWSEQALVEIYDKAWLPLLDKESLYFEELKKD